MNEWIIGMSDWLNDWEACVNNWLYLFLIEKDTLIFAKYFFILYFKYKFVDLKKKLYNNYHKGVKNLKIIWYSALFKLCANSLKKFLTWVWGVISS